MSFAGDELSYENVIHNLNVLDYDYYFRIIKSILKADAAETLMILNEIIESGFDGQHFIIGLGEHIRNLLVCKDQETVGLLEVSENLKAQYLDQAGLCDTGFLLRALSINNQYDVQYKESNNKRLHIELSLLQMCGLMGFPATQSKKDKPSQPLPKPGEIPATPHQAKEPKPEIKKAATQAPKEPPATDKPIKETPPPVAKQEKKAEVDEDILPSNMSIKKSSEMLNGSKDKKKQEEDARPKLKNEFSADQLREAWKKTIAETFKHSDNLKSSLTKKVPEIKEDFKLLLTLDNKVLEREMKDRMQDLHDHLRSILKNDMILLKTKVATVEQQDKEAYFPDEIYKKMVEKNPEVKNLRDQLDLEIDF